MNKKEVELIINTFENDPSKVYIVKNDSSYCNTAESDKIYSKLRYYIKKNRKKMIVTRQYNTVMLVK